ncbi:PREDICTED: F-box only protein 47 [Thamnophis sirtalis]|uniref:F-box only protein 47 n=1 Tax=Thamnophis sirtalis TaxID=35019 RepID=A0A6I9Y6G3_9SAUR|nr:PREDICTED: F-box only protein 47 [Thamnophis sirtalis]
MGIKDYLMQCNEYLSNFWGINNEKNEIGFRMDPSTSTMQGEKSASPTRNNSTLSPNEKQNCSNAMPTYFSFMPTLGDFKGFPLEIFEFMLGYLSVKDISMMSMVSKIIRDRIINYISTPSGNRKFFPQDFHNQDQSDSAKSSILQHYSSLGLLFKRCTLLLPTKERLKYIYKRFLEIPCFQFYGCADPLHCLGLQCYGVFLQTVTAGWDEDECERVFNFLCDVTSLPQRIQRVVSSKPGRFRKLELRIRTFCRGVLLKHWILQSDSVFWLTCILKPWPSVIQARLLYLMFGPASTEDGNVDWRNMIQGPTDENNLKELADAVKLLYDTEKDEWLANDIVSLVDELAVIPQEWHLENSARFLILCGNNICFPFMASKAVDGRAIELARLVVFLALVCEKDLYCMGWSVKMMQKVCNVFSSTTEKNVFLQSIENAFAQMIMDALQLVISGEHDEEETSFLNLFHLVNAQANFHKEILYLTMNYEE